MIKYRKRFSQGDVAYDMPLNQTELEKNGMIKEVPKDQY